MNINLREKANAALQQIDEAHLPAIVRWLELLAVHQSKTDVEPEELWLLATGELARMNEEIEQAQPIEDWRKYLNEI